MKAHIFREFTYEPTPVTALCSNNDILVAFRRNKTVDFIDSTSFIPFVRLNVGYVILQSMFLDLNTIIGTTVCQKLIALDVTTLKFQVLNNGIVNVSGIFNSVAYAESFFYYTTVKNEIYEIKNGKNNFIARETSAISTLLHTNHALLFGCINGWIRVFRDGKCITEIDAGGVIKKITQNDDENYIAILHDGKAVLFNISVGIIVDSVEVRTNALNAAICVNGVVHISGEDSRIISYGVSSGKFRKICQADFHSAEVLCMINDNDRLVTAGEDSIIIYNTLVNGRYLQTRVYEEKIKYGKSKNYFYVANDKSINLYNFVKSEVDAKIQVPNACGSDTIVSDAQDRGITCVSQQDLSGTSERDLNNVSSNASNQANEITFKISSDILERSNQKEATVQFFLKFNINDYSDGQVDTTLLSVDVSYDEKYMAYSTNKETLFYNMYCGSKLNIEKIRSFGPASQILFSENFLIIVELSMKIVIFDLNTFKVSMEIPYEDRRERVGVLGSLLIISCLKKVVDLLNTSEPTQLDICDSILQIKAAKDDIIFMTQNTEGQCELSSYCKKFVAKPFDEKKIVNMVNSNIFFDDRFLFVVKDSNIKKYEIGCLINGAMEIDGDIFVLQTSWNYLKSKMKPSVFKKKFSN